MKIHQMSVAEALASVRGGTDGLSSAEALRRQAEYGPNLVRAVERAPLAARLAREYFHFFSLILWMAAALAFVAEWRDPGQGMAKVGISIVAVILVSGTFSFWQEYRVAQSLDSLRRLLPQQVQVLRDGVVATLAAEQLVPGDMLLVEAGQSVPADCRLVEAHALRVNTATITGESAPKARDALESQEEQWINSRNILLAGTSVVAGRARALVFATGQRTEFGKIAHLAQTAGDTASPLRLELAHLSRRIAGIAIAIGGGVLAVGSLLGIPFWRDLMFSIGIIVSMVPEGLLPTLTLALVLAAQRMARRQVLIRHLPAVETLGAATVICTDKTGTLTENRMRVHSVTLGLEQHALSELEQDSALVRRAGLLIEAAAVCHSLAGLEVRGAVALQGDPMEIALVEMAQRLGGTFPAARRVEEYPFDSDRMRQSVQIEMRGGCILFCKGAPETVLPLCVGIVEGGAARPLEPAQRAAIVAAQERMAARGQRVLAFACRRYRGRCEQPIPEQELEFLGLVGLEDPPRPEVPDAIRRCRAAGIRVIMVTGDHPRTAVAVARAIGLVQANDPTVITGTALQRLSATQLQLALDTPDVVFARLAADQKLRIVNALRDKQHVVAVTGDGVNDAPALKAAHIGIAMGRSGTDVAREAADMVLLDDNFASIVNAVEEGRALFGNIRRFLTYVLVHNVAELVPFLAFALFGIPVALTPIQALAIDMGTDSLTALGLGAERPDAQSMRLPPRRRGQRLLDGALALRAYLFLGLIEAGAAMSAFLYVLHQGGWSWGQMPAPDAPLYLQATTATLCAIIALQVVNVFLCRSSIRSIRITGLGGNRWILAGVVLELVLLVLIAYTPLGNEMFATAPPPATVWLCILPFALLMLLLEESRKACARRGLTSRMPGRWPPPSGQTRPAAPSSDLT
ncbi:MAG: hypothetical protein RJA36_968 [Pseudomonadota bacterium]|jgi:calcium-translocating P-type ATPase